MNLGVTGATGFVGRHLIDVALRRGHEIIAFTRHPQIPIPGCQMRLFSTSQRPDLSQCDAVIHLAGEPVFGLWTREKMRRIYESRIEGTRRVVEAIEASANPPEALISGSAIGYYGHGAERELIETSPKGSGFLADTAADWEAEALKAQSCRVVLLRTGLVLGKSGGALKMMAPVFRAGLGGPIGSGRQWMSWIHLEDHVRLTLFAAENLEVKGPLNATAPWPVRNEQFTQALATRLRRPALLRVPAFALRLLGEFRHELLDSKRVLPAAATEHGFGYQFPEIESAFQNLFA